MSKLLQTAIIYDFDGTLARGNMQETSFIPALGLTPKQLTRSGRKPSSPMATTS